MTTPSIERNNNHSFAQEAFDLVWPNVDHTFHVPSSQPSLHSPALPGNFQVGLSSINALPSSYTCMFGPAHPNLQGNPPHTIPSDAPRPKQHHDKSAPSSMFIWASSPPPPPPPPPPSPRPFMFTDDDKYIITREGHVPVSVYLTQLHRIGAQLVHNPQGASFQLGVSGLPGAVFHFHPVFLTLQSKAFRDLYDTWDGRCGMFEITVPCPESFPGVWEFLFTGDVATFLRNYFSDSYTLKRTWAVMKCLQLKHLPEEVIFRTRLEFEAVRLRPPG